MLLMLVETLAADEKQKFQHLYDEYSRTLLVYARSILKSEALAEDAVQEAYIRVLKNLQKINPEACSETRRYLVTIVRNVSINLYNRHVKGRETVLEEVAEQPQEGYVDPTWNLYDAKELAKDMKRWIKSLSSEEQLLLMYRIYHKWTYEQIEAAFGIKSSTASSKVCRARNKLIAMYEKERGEQNG